mmetsp:Transcript_3063/g.5880  ORF Transcript_3063/g.5880 Transcript_3063/m.5880 type:complete len:263 (-) Transcript_3063:637-1425(-)
MVQSMESSRLVGFVPFLMCASGGRGQSETVFVAGGTGRLGFRVVKELAGHGMRVRLGCRNVEKARELVRRSNVEPDLVEVVPMVLDGDLRTAIGEADRVVSALGASELVPWSPFAVDYVGTNRLIQAARDTGKVKHFVLVTSLGTGNPLLFPAGILNLFWGILVWKKLAEDTLVQSGLPFTVVRPGGMERPKDDFKETHNTILYSENSLGGGVVSRLQVAEVVAEALINPDASAGKVAEVIATVDAPKKPIADMFRALPSKL